MAEEGLKPVTSMSRRALEREAKTIGDVRLIKEPKELSDQGLRSAVRLHRRRRGMPE